MITPLCYFTKSQPKEGTTSNFNDPVSDKVTNAIHDVRMDLFFNRHRFSLRDTLIRKYDEKFVNQLEAHIADIKLFDIGLNRRIGNEIMYWIRHANVYKMREKFKLKFEE